ncbi:hypothetical protein EXIGLDRAFT_140647 [Exidia glandulosa HHB12029]|uniref:NADH-ubiquinone oxidoreductase 9.5 kDa subunit n=1 Tax=Exidia glandulosa HHB12029 TaxID=1314781 RepID=A0A165FVW4_EXIGL|nr:hypothetical protein EXIGLDRAFT_140647 [Exidia glandulosa HHB12029]
MSALYRTLQRHAHETPALFWACVLGGVGPVFLVSANSIASYKGVRPPPPVPTSYPVPSGPRQQVSGYDDPE